MVVLTSWSSAPARRGARYWERSEQSPLLPPLLSRIPVPLQPFIFLIFYFLGIGFDFCMKFCVKKLEFQERGKSAGLLVYSIAPLRVLVRGGGGEGLKTTHTHTQYNSPHEKTETRYACYSTTEDREYRVWELRRKCWDPNGFKNVRHGVCVTGK